MVQAIDLLFAGVVHGRFTRRFSARPASVSLDAAGDPSPSPLVSIRPAATPPFSTMYFLTASARLLEGFCYSQACRCYPYVLGHDIEVRIFLHQFCHGINVFMICRLYICFVEIKFDIKQLFAFFGSAEREGNANTVEKIVVSFIQRKNIRTSARRSILSVTEFFIPAP
jgi:hypothetical protein